MKLLYDIYRSAPAALTAACLAIGASHAARMLGENGFAQGSSDAEVAAHFKAGEEAARTGDTERAIREYREVLRLSSDLTEARVNLGLNCYLAGEYQEAMVELEKARRQKPQLVPANLFLGMTYLKLGLPAKASPPLEEVLRRDPTNQEALRALASSYLQQDDYRRATTAYRKLFGAIADPIEARYALGQHYLAMAKQLSDELSRRFQDTSWEARLVGDVLREQQQWVDAAAQYRRALALDGEAPGLHVALGDTLLRQGKLEDAAVEYRAELRRDARSEEALLGLAAADLGRGDAAATLENVTRIWEIYPPFLEHQTEFPWIEIDKPKLDALEQDLDSRGDSPAREFLRARVDRAAGYNRDVGLPSEDLLISIDAWTKKQNAGSSRDGNYEAACAAHHYAECARLIRAKKAPSSEQGLLLGRALTALGNDTSAASTFAEVLNRDSTNAAARYWLIRAFQRLARECFDQMVQRDPDSWRVHQMRGEYYQSQLSYGQAIEEFQVALKAQPESAELHEQLGVAYLLSKDRVQGTAEIEKALQIDSTRSLSLFLLGRVYFQDREVPKSVEYFERALRFAPTFIPARAALGRAYMRMGNPGGAVPELEKAVVADSKGDLYFLLAQAYRQTGKNDLAENALSASEELRKKSAAYHQAGVSIAEEELGE